MQDKATGTTRERPATGGATNIGDREENQDVWHSGIDINRQELALVCDGLGGERAGATAAKVAAGAFFDNWLVLGKMLSDSKRLREALNLANASLHDHIVNDSRLYGMATTLLAVEIGAGKPVWTSVGDSPLWHWSRKTKTARQVNERHNPPERPSTLLSCLTGEPIPIIGNGTIEDTEPGDLLIAASDGLDTLTQGRARERDLHRPRETSPRGSRNGWSRQRSRSRRPARTTSPPSWHACGDGKRQRTDRRGRQEATIADGDGAHGAQALRGLRAVRHERTVGDSARRAARGPQRANHGTAMPTLLERARPAGGVVQRRSRRSRDRREAERGRTTMKPGNKEERIHATARIDPSATVAKTARIGMTQPTGGEESRSARTRWSVPTACFGERTIVGARCRAARAARAPGRTRGSTTTW